MWKYIKSIFAIIYLNKFFNLFYKKLLSKQINISFFYSIFFIKNQIFHKNKVSKNSNCENYEIKISSINKIFITLIKK